MDRTPMADGQQITHRVNGALIILQCVRPDMAYRVSVCYGSTGAEVAPLSKSYPSEAQARTAARSITHILSDITYPLSAISTLLNPHEKEMAA